MEGRAVLGSDAIFHFKGLRPKASLVDRLGETPVAVGE
jgi:hypothetical protein